MTSKLALAASAIAFTALTGVSRADDTPLQAQLGRMADRSFQCALDQTLYVSPGGKSIIWLGTGELKDNKLPETTVAISAANARLTAPGTVRFELPAGAGDKALTLRMLSATEKKKPGMAGVAAELFVNDDKVGDNCTATPGRAGFVEGRFNTIRANLCGNDPAPGCIAELRKRCGTELAPACLAEAKPVLAKISKAYFDRMNARAKR